MAICGDSPSAFTSSPMVLDARALMLGSFPAFSPSQSPAHRFSSVPLQIPLLHSRLRQRKG